MQLFSYYSLDECKDKAYILEKLDSYKEDGKVEYDFIERDLILVEDIDLSDSEIEELIEDFDKYDVIADLDRSLYDDESSEDFDDFEDEEF